MPTPGPRVATEVAEALADGRGVVALESTLIAQGLPWPHNLETAHASEAVIRLAGSVPATIAIIGGLIHIGLSGAQLEEVARSTGRFIKASRRDLSWVVARRLDATTTVSATLWLARAAGIKVLATGGLGGVHREAATTFDISTDLDELARADGTLVVCSGVKSILDIPATLELLESQGVPIVGYRTDEFPAFTSRSSGLPLGARVDSPNEANALLATHRNLKLPAAIVLAQAVPDEVALDRQVMEDALALALSEARDQNIRGKEVTPFLLERIRWSTEGRSLSANKALIIANAGLAGAIASLIIPEEPTPLQAESS